MSGRTGTASELRTASSDGPAAAQKQDRDEAAHAAHHRGDVAPVALALVSSVVRRTEQANWRPAAVVGMGGEAPAASPLDSRHVSARRCARGRQLSSLPLDACVSVCAVADDRPAPRPDGHITSVSEQGNGTLGGAEGPSRASGDGAARPSEPGVESEPSRLPWRPRAPPGSSPPDTASYWRPGRCRRGPSPAATRSAASRCDRGRAGETSKEPQAQATAVRTTNGATRCSIWRR
jgi:hypothetical protein